MQSTLCLGFIGLGVVGGAVANAFASVFSTVGYDIKTAPDKKDAVLKTDMIFLSLPTATINSAQDQSALESTCEWLKAQKYQGPIIVKSTVLPGTCDRLKREYGLRIVHNPEFLTAKTPLQDFMAQPSVVLSGQGPDVELVAQTYGLLLPKAGIVTSEDYKVTEIAKYTHNLFLATKVGFMNEIFSVCKAMGVSYDQVVTHALSQEKLGTTHVKVPNDGQLGFGGMCFPKDIQALLTWGKSMGLDLMQMNATNEANLKIRPETKC